MRIGKQRRSDVHRHPTQQVHAQSVAPGPVAQDKAQALQRIGCLCYLELFPLTSAEESDEYRWDKYRTADEAHSEEGHWIAFGEQGEDNQPKEKSNQKPPADRDRHAISNQRVALVVVQRQLRGEGGVGTTDQGEGGVEQHVHQGEVKTQEELTPDGRHDP